MSTARQIDFSRWPKESAAASEGCAVPYLDIDGEDEPVDFLFRYKGKYSLIARGNLQLLKGREKTGKSSMGVALMVAALKGGFLQIEPNRGDYTLLWIDTEQDRATLRQKGRAALGMAGEPFSTQRVHIVTLKSENPAERLKMSLMAIRETKPDFVLVDGAADLCDDFNDGKQSAAVANELLKATEESKCAILCVIHTNKKDDEARGHLGTILQQKSTEVYEVTKQGDTATIRQEKCRFADIPDISFRFADGFTLKEPPTEAAKYDARKQDLQAKFARLFDGVDEYTYKEICESYSEQEASCKSAAQKAIKAAVDFGILEKQGEKRNTRYTYLFPNIQKEYEDEDEDL